MRAELLLKTIAAAGIQIRPAIRTKALAVYPAQNLHRKRQQDLLAQDVPNGQLRSSKERRFRLFFTQLDLFVLIKHIRVTLPEEEIKGFGDIVSGRLKAARAHQFDARAERSV